jgi:MFS family permease
MIGNVLEWYDFAIYGYFAATIGRQFFPREDTVTQLLSAFGVFAIGYLMRPLGGVLVGHIGDTFGRRAALTFSVVAMAIPTFLMGLLPGYQTIGVLAPIGLTLLRVVQGLSVGGEYTGSMVFLVEQAPEGRRGLMGALGASGSTAGILLGSAVGATFAASMSTAALDAWGWRIPFLLGLLVGIAGYIFRRYVLETGAVEKHAPSHSRDTSRSLACGCGLRRFIGLQRGDLLYWFCLSGELVADRRPHSAVTLARNQLVEHDDPAASANRRRMVERPDWTQASNAFRKHGRAYRCPAPVLVVEPSLGVARPAWAAWPCIADGCLLRGLARHSGRGCASDRAMHGGSAGL